MIGAAHGLVHGWLAGNAAALRDHLLFSTIVLVVLLALSHLPFLRPRTRYALLFLGVAKFLLPAPALAWLAGSLTMHTMELPSFPMMTATFTFGAGPGRDSEAACVLGAVWLAGAVVMTLLAFNAQRRWRLTVRLATAGSPRETETMRRLAHQSAFRHVPRVVRSSAGIPATAGLLHPVVLLPEASADLLGDDELTAVLAHELTHVERRHNLAAAVQGVALSLFWFHPALWLAKNRLQAEAEKDCDERVMNFVPDPPTYLSGMLKVTLGFIAPQPAGVACMSSRQLKERMDHLMKQHETGSRSVPHRLAFGLAIVAVAASTMFVSAGEPATKAGKASPAAEKAAEDGVTPPQLVTKVEPVYPEAARENRVQGLVVVATTIDVKGNVTGVSVAKGIEGADGKALEEAALAAVKQWKFKPARKDGKPVGITYNVTINFKLS